MNNLLPHEKYDDECVREFEKSDFDMRYILSISDDAERGRALVEAYEEFKVESFRPPTESEKRSQGAWT